MAFLAAIPAAIGGLVGGGGGGLGAALGAVGSIVSGLAGFGAASYQAKVAKMNQDIANENAVKAMDQGAKNAMEQDIQTRAMLGEQLAAQSASGLSVGGRSQMLTRKAAQELGRRDRLNVIEDARSTAYNFRTDAANARAQGKMSMFEGVNSLIGGFINAGGSLIGKSTSTRKRFGNDRWMTPSGTSLRTKGLAVA